MPHGPGKFMGAEEAEIVTGKALETSKNSQDVMSLKQLSSHQ